MSSPNASPTPNSMVGTSQSRDSGTGSSHSQQHQRQRGANNNSDQRGARPTRQQATARKGTSLDVEAGGQQEKQQSQGIQHERGRGVTRSQKRGLGHSWSRRVLQALPGDHRHKYRILFRKLDANNSGTLDRDHADQAVAELGFDPSRLDVKECMDSWFENASDEMTSSEFVVMMDEVRDLSLQHEPSKLVGSIHRTVSAARRMGSFTLRDRKHSMMVQDGKVGRLCVRLVRVRGINLEKHKSRPSDSDFQAVPKDEEELNQFLDKFEVRVTVMGCHPMVQEGTEAVEKSSLLQTTSHAPFNEKSDETLSPDNPSLKKASSMRGRNPEQFIQSKQFKEHSPKEMLFGKQVVFEKLERDRQTGVHPQVQLEFLLVNSHEASNYDRKFYGWCDVSLSASMRTKGLSTRDTSRMRSNTLNRGPAGGWEEVRDFDDELDMKPPVKFDQPKASTWDELKWFPITDGQGYQVGEAYIGIRLESMDHVLSQEAIGSADSDVLTPTEQLLFRMYDLDEDGLLSPTEFLSIVNDLKQVHGDIDSLAGRHSNRGCLSFFVGLPETDLVSFIKYGHTLTTVFVGTQPGMHWSDQIGGVEFTWFGRLIVVLMTLLYSLCINLFIELTFSNFKQDLPAMAQAKVFTKTLADVIGCSILKELLAMANLSCLPPILRSAFNFLVATTFFSLIIYFTVDLLDQEQTESVAESFLAVWFLARITEVFHLGTLWAFKVSYGSSVGCSLI